MATQTAISEPAFALYAYLTSPTSARANTVLGGSAAPELSFSDLISLSTAPEKTREALTGSLLSQPLNLGSDRGSPALRETIASTYAATSNITANDVMVANGTTGANHIVERSLLSSGDHVIVQYPIYGSCIEEPLAIGCNLSYLRSDASNGWRVNPEDLRSLIQPGKTKMLFLNSPVNPTGTYIDSNTQRAIIEIAKEHDVVIHCDEIFHPLYHDPALRDNPVSTSFVEHADLGYDKIIVTSSLSKCYGLSGVRIGWITTPSTALYQRFIAYRKFSILSLSCLDDIIATEALSPRCRPGIIQKHVSLAQHNLDLIAAFVEKYPGRVDWVRPTAGAVAFVRFLDAKTGQGRDDVEFCQRLVRDKGVLLSPGSLCFRFAEEGMDNVDEFRGRVRFHFTCLTETLEKGLQGIAEFLDEEKDTADGQGSNARVVPIRSK